MGKKLLIMDTILRDAHQSQAATRMRIEDMLPGCELLDAVGYYALEVWGGATFDSCLRFLGEDPWERLRKLRKALPNTKLQMLFRGQNILGYKHYADDVVNDFVAKTLENGCDIIRIFDALNDTRNLEAASAPPRNTAASASPPSATPSAPYTTRTTLSSWAKSWWRWAPTPFASRIWPTFFCLRTPISSSSA